MPHVAFRRLEFGLGLWLLAALGIVAWFVPASPATAAEPIERTVLLPPGPGNPRNSEGDLIRLRDGRLMLVYTHFEGGAGDHAAAYLAARYSSDGGRTWTKEDETVLPNEAGLNVMSVSLLRLADGRLALFYLRKNSQQDCRPIVRFSSDEGGTWSEPTVIVPDDKVGYYVLNNDRVVQLASGRLIAPLAQHFGPGQEKYTRARLLEAAADCARRMGGTCLWLTTYDHLPFNRPYYARRGYEVVPEEACGPDIRHHLEQQRRYLPEPSRRVAMRRAV